MNMLCCTYVGRSEEYVRKCTSKAWVDIRLCLGTEPGPLHQSFTSRKLSAFENDAFESDTEIKVEAKDTPEEAIESDKHENSEVSKITDTEVNALHRIGTKGILAPWT